MSSTLRWILLAPGAIAGWLLVLFLLGPYHRTLEAQCSSGQDIPECRDPWLNFLRAYLPAIGAGLSAIVVVLVVYWVAPRHKHRAAWISFSSGAAICLLTLTPGQVLEAFCAIAAGLGAALLLSRLQTVPLMPPNNSLERSRDR